MAILKFYKSQLALQTSHNSFHLGVIKVQTNMNLNTPSTYVDMEMHIQCQAGDSTLLKIDP